MLRYATDETEELKPLTLVLAHKLNAKTAELRRNGTISWICPDSKTQVTSIYTAATEKEVMTIKYADKVNNVVYCVMHISISCSGLTFVRWSKTC